MAGRPAGRRAWLTAIALIAWFALGLQLYLMIAHPPESAPLRDLLAFYFSYFTILTNLIVALAACCLLWPRAGWGRFFARPPVQAGVAVYITMVSVLYSLLLRSTWNPHGLQKLADELLHDVVPGLFVLYWLLVSPKAGLRWRHALLWLAYPLAYFLWIMTQGAELRWYPYYFINPAAIGYARVLTHAAVLLAACWLTGLAAVAYGRWRTVREDLPASAGTPA